MLEISAVSSRHRQADVFRKRCLSGRMGITQWENIRSARLAAAVLTVNGSRGVGRGGQGGTPECSPGPSGHWSVE